MGDLLHFEDFTPGLVIELGSREVTAEAIISFGLAYDPLPVHTDPDASADGPYGGLVASGRHSALIWMRLYVDAVLSRAADGLARARRHSLAQARAPRRRAPRPDHSARGEAVGDEPCRGTVLFQGEVVNQHGEVATLVRGRNFFARGAS